MTNIRGIFTLRGSRIAIALLVHYVQGLIELRLRCKSKQSKSVRLVKSIIDGNWLFWIEAPTVQCDAYTLFIVLVMEHERTHELREPLPYE